MTSRLQTPCGIHFSSRNVHSAVGNVDLTVTNKALEDNHKYMPVYLFFFHLSKQLCVQVNVLYDISAIIKMSGHNRCCCITLYMKKNCPWNRLISKSPLITDVQVIDESQVEIINFCNIDTLSHVYFNVFTIWLNKNQTVPPLRPLVDASQTSGVPQSSIPRPIIFIIRHLIYQNTIHMSLFRQLRAKTPPATLDISTTFAIRTLHLF